MVKLTREERKEQNIYNETLRRAAEGDTSNYVKSQMSSYGLDMPNTGIRTDMRVQEDKIDGMEQQEQALNLINRLSSTPSWEDLLSVKEQLVGIPAITTDQDESRNMYQYLINEMLRSGKEPRGAQLLDVAQIPHGWRRTGDTTFTNPNNPDLFRDLKGLATFNNPGVFNLADQDNEGILGITPFQKGWAQDELKIKDYGQLFESLITPTPLKLYNAAKAAQEKITNTDLYYDTMRTLSNAGVGALETAVKPVNFLAEQIEKLRQKIAQ